MKDQIINIELSSSLLKDYDNRKVDNNCKEEKIKCDESRPKYEDNKMGIKFFRDLHQMSRQSSPMLDKIMSYSGNYTKKVSHAKKGRKKEEIFDEMYYKLVLVSKAFGANIIIRSFSIRYAEIPFNLLYSLNKKWGNQASNFCFNPLGLCACGGLIFAFFLVVSAIMICLNLAALLASTFAFLVGALRDFKSKTQPIQAILLKRPSQISFLSPSRFVYENKIEYFLACAEKERRESSTLFGIL